MPPHKGKARGYQQQAPPQPSDYETDAPPPALDVPLPPPRSNEELNFSVLRRVYPELLAIEHTTPYVVLYAFNLEKQGWEKFGVEGTLFICQLTPSPMGAERYCAVILNRQGLDNFYLELTSSEEMEIADPYIIVQGDQVYGLWIFADPPPASTAHCRDETAKKMMEIADRARASRKAKENGGKNGVREAAEQTEAASAVPMGRQLSLRELFGQQREQDAGFGMQHHNNHPPPNMHPQQAYMSQLNPAPAQQDVLVDLEENHDADKMASYRETNHRPEDCALNEACESDEPEKCCEMNRMHAHLDMNEVKDHFDTDGMEETINTNGTEELLDTDEAKGHLDTSNGIDMDLTQERCQATETLDWNATNNKDGLDQETKHQSDSAVPNKSHDGFHDGSHDVPLDEARTEPIQPLLPGPSRPETY